MTEKVLSVETEARFFAPLKLTPPDKRTHRRIEYGTSIKRRLEDAEQRGLDLTELSDKALIRVCLDEARNLSGLTSNRRIQLRHVGLIVRGKGQGHRVEWTPRGLQILEAIKKESGRVE